MRLYCRRFFSSSSQPKRHVIMGAAGFDYHLFNNVYRNNSDVRVLAFTAAAEQNVGTDPSTPLRPYPASLAGPLYPKGIPTIPEHQLEKFIADNKVDEVVLAYSDLQHDDVMHVASKVLAAGATFRLEPPKSTMIKLKVPVIAVVAVRTGCGKSAVSLQICEELRKRGINCVAVREPMPYGDLEKQVCMRMATYEDLANCTIEEREEYEQYVGRGLVIYSGVDYNVIGQAIAKDPSVDAVLFDGGNNEIPFYVPDIQVTLADALRPGHERGSHPGEVNARMADYLLIAKCDSAPPENVSAVSKSLREMNNRAPIIPCDSAVTVEGNVELRNKRVLCIEDGPTTTHGGMGIGAAVVAAERAGAIISRVPIKDLPESFRALYTNFPHLGHGLCLPALAYTPTQLRDFQIAVDVASRGVDIILCGSPIDMKRLITCNVPLHRVSYALRDKEKQAPVRLEHIVDKFEKIVADSKKKKD